PFPTSRTIHGRACASLGGERVYPPKTGKSGEIAVARTERQAMFDRKRSQMRVGNEMTMERGVGDQTTENLCMPVRRPGNPGLFGRQPFTDLLPSLLDGICVLENARIGAHPQEREQAGPRQAHGRDATQLRVKPILGDSM